MTKNYSRDQNCSLGLKDCQPIRIKAVFRFHYMHMKSQFKQSQNIGAEQYFSWFTLIFLNNKDKPVLCGLLRLYKITLIKQVLCRMNC